MGALISRCGYRKFFFFVFLDVSRIHHESYSNVYKRRNFFARFNVKVERVYIVSMVFRIFKQPFFFAENFFKFLCQFGKLRTHPPKLL